MTLRDDFFHPTKPSLKICGVTSASDAEDLIHNGVPALGINFWQKSKRFCPPNIAGQFLPALENQIFRVGVFVNNARELAPQLLANRLIDAVQLHGDEPDSEIQQFLADGTPTIRALSLGLPAENDASLHRYQQIARNHSAPFALLLDAHAPGVYGGTGKTIDWLAAAAFIKNASPLPVFLAGGLTPANALESLQVTRPAGLDIASGAESAPGIKDPGKVRSLVEAISRFSNPTS